MVQDQAAIMNPNIRGRKERPCAVRAQERSVPPLLHEKLPVSLLQLLVGPVGIGEGLGSESHFLCLTK